jgi:hypothetical protein
MGKIGFILLLVGGLLVLLAGVNTALDTTTLGYIATIIDTYVTPHVGIPNLGTTIANLLYLLTFFGAVLIIAGAVIWFAAGHGCLAFLGKILTSIGGFTITYQVIWQVIIAVQTGVFSKPLAEILAYFASLGLGFAALVLVLVGSMLGAGRPKVKVVKVPSQQPSAPPPEQTA